MNDVLPNRTTSATTNSISQNQCAVTRSMASTAMQATERFRQQSKKGRCGVTD